MSRNIVHHEHEAVPIHRVDNAFLSLSDLVLESKKRKSYNESPILHTILTQHNGIEITGTFKTDDGTDDGQFSYITILKQHNSPIAWDGLGVAWRKGDASTYNVYIVDNNALEEDVIMMGEQVIQTGGINKFLAAGKHEILINTTYYFKMVVSQFYGITVYIDKDGTYDDAAIVTTGDVWDSIAHPAANGTDFGVSVLTTRGYRWWYDEIKIASTISNWSQTLLKFYTPSTSISDTQQANVYINAIGTWNLGTASGLHAFIYNTDNSGYEVLGTTYASKISNGIIEVQTPSGMSSYRDDQDYVNVLLTTVSGYDDATVTLNYAYMDNVLLSGVHTGNFVDIYVNAPEEIAFDTATNVTVVNSRISITDAEFTLPVVQIAAVRTTVGDAREFRVEPNTKGLHGSTSSDSYIQLYETTATVNIDYRYLTTGAGMQTLVQSSEFRGPGQNNLIKPIPIVLITFNTLSYTGGPAVAELRTKLKKWVNDLTTSLEISDLIAYLYELGVNYIDLTTFRIDYTRYNTIGTMLTDSAKLDSSYTLGSMENFYTDENEMAGIIRTA